MHPMTIIANGGIGQILLKNSIIRMGDFSNENQFTLNVSYQ